MYNLLGQKWCGGDLTIATLVAENQDDMDYLVLMNTQCTSELDDECLLNVFLHEATEEECIQVEEENLAILGYSNRQQLINGKLINHN